MGHTGDFNTITEIKNDMKRHYDKVTSTKENGETCLWAVTSDNQNIVVWVIRKWGKVYVYKNMDALQGPYYYTCPLKLIDQVGTGYLKNDYGHATYESWVEKVYAYHATVKAQKKLWELLEAGLTVNLTDGYSIPEVTLDYQHSNTKWVGTYNNALYTITCDMLATPDYT